MAQYPSASRQPNPCPENPFTPSFGEMPLVMAGRQEFLWRMRRALERSNRAPELTTLVSGARGTGKTVLLGYVAELAEERGWISVNVSALPGMLQEILAQAQRKARKALGQKDRLRLTGVGLGDVASLEWEREDQLTSTWRTSMEDVLDALQPEGVGLVITVDEVNPMLDEMVELSSTYQHFVRERRRVALIMADLPYNVDELAGNKSVTFLRRAERERLGRIPHHEIEEAWRRTIAESGRVVGSDATQAATTAIDGFPFMLQLVGYRAWDQSPDSREISYEDVMVGARLARSEMASRVLESTWRELSDGDVAFLAAMLPDATESTMADIAARMGRSRAYAGTYRKRMLQQGIIGERRRGVVGFDLPSFREFLQEKLGQ